MYVLFSLSNILMNESRRAEVNEDDDDDDGDDEVRAALCPTILKNMLTELVMDPFLMTHPSVSGVMLCRSEMLLQTK
jgi:hypothetical protein